MSARVDWKTRAIEAERACGDLARIIDEERARTRLDAAHVQDALAKIGHTAGEVLGDLVDLLDTAESMGSPEAVRRYILETIHATLCRARRIQLSAEELREGAKGGAP
jgi:hypothetical protein